MNHIAAAPDLFWSGQAERRPHLFKRLDLDLRSPLGRDAELVSQVVQSAAAHFAVFALIEPTRFNDAVRRLVV